MTQPPVRFRASLRYIFGALLRYNIAKADATVVVAIEIITLAYIRHRNMDTPFLQAAFQVIVGGVLVFLTGYLIGSS